MRNLDLEKSLVGQAAAELVQPGQRVGLGTGSTVLYFLHALAERDLPDLRCVATSVATEVRARGLGLPVEPFEDLDRLDIAVDGADQIAPDRWLVKGAGGAHVREKIVEAASERFVVIGSSDKPVDAIRPPIPLELLAFGLDATLHALEHATLRHVPRSPDNGVIADYHGDVPDPEEVAARLSAIPGVVGHGLFAPELVTDVLIARDGEVVAL
jgi:ribose 5-phosphate isomerase A